MVLATLLGMRLIRHGPFDLMTMGQQAIPAATPVPMLGRC